MNRKNSHQPRDSVGMINGSESESVNDVNIPHLDHHHKKWKLLIKTAQILDFHISTFDIFNQKNLRISNIGKSRQKSN